MKRQAMQVLSEIFNAGRVRRWHSNPDMSWTDDYNDAHQGRVARILLALHPEPSALLLAAALTHDDGELEAGDMNRNVKNANHELREMVRDLENQGRIKIWGAIPETFLSDKDKKWLHLADRIDGQMWMLHKNPNLMKRNDWIAERVAIEALADALGVLSEVKEIYKITRRTLQGEGEH